MSAIPLHGPRPRTRPATRTRAVSRQRNLVGEAVLWYSLAFTSVVALTYGASSLVGQTMMEQARRSSIQARERSLDARKDVATLRQRVERLVGMRSVEDWAKMRGYVLDGLPVQAPAKVAMVVKNGKQR